MDQYIFMLYFHLKRCIRIMAVLAIFLVLPSEAETKIAVFPLVNTSYHSIAQWCGAILPECFSRLLPGTPSYQLWDPVFMFTADSSAWKLDSSAFVLQHYRQWNWDYAIGGSYSVDSSGIEVVLKIASVVNDSVIMQRVTLKGKLDALNKLDGALFVQGMKLAGYDVPVSAAVHASQSISTSADAFATYVAGYWFELEGNYAAALTAYNRAGEIDPQCYFAFFRAGKLYSDAHIYDNSRDCFDKCKNSDNPEILAGVAEFYAQHESADKAQSFFQAHSKQLNASPSGIRSMAHSFILSGDYQRAEAILTRAVAEGTPDLETEELLGNVYLLSGEPSQAVAVFDRLLLHRPGYIRYSVLLGAAYRSSGNLKESVRVLDAAKNLDPSNNAVLINLAQTYSKLGWYNDAEQLLLQVRDREPAAPGIYLNLGIIYWQLGKRNDAQAMLDKADKLGASRQILFSTHGTMLFFSGSVRDAISMYEKAVKSGLKNQIVYSNLANSYLALHKWKNASKYFDEILRISPNRLDILTLQADIAVKRKKTKDAELWYRRILEQVPNNEDVCARLAGLLVSQKRYKDALPPLEACLRFSADNKKLLILRADIYEKMGWYDVALMQYQSALREFPDSWEVNLGVGRNMYNMIKFKNALLYDNALYSLKTAAGMNPNDPEADYLIGLIYMDYKKYRELALTHWNKALSVAVNPAMKKSLKACIARAEK